MDINVPRGKFNSKILQAEPMVCWLTSTEIAICVWTHKRIAVFPSFKSVGENGTYPRKLILASQIIEGNTPTVIRFGCLTDPLIDSRKGPPQIETTLFLEAESGKTRIPVFELFYQIPKYWDGSSEEVPDFSILMGSCFRLLGDNYSKNIKYPLFEQYNKYSLKANLGLFLGDNIYLNNHYIQSESGLFQRYHKLRTMPLFNGIWTNLEWCAVADDHDLGIDNGTSGVPYFYLCSKVFQKMWQNNSYNPISPMIWSIIRYDIFILGLDGQSFRTPPGKKNCTILGKDQINWLRQSLYSIKKINTNPFILICVGQPFIAPGTTYFSSYPEDSKKITDMIIEFNLKNVIFLTGDSHFSDISEKTIANNIKIYEFRCSPFSSTPQDPSKKPNPDRVPNSAIEDNNFAQLFFSGKYGKRRLEYKNVLPDGSTPVLYSLEQQF